MIRFNGMYPYFYFFFFLNKAVGPGGVSETKVVQGIKHNRNLIKKKVSAKTKDYVSDDKYLFTTSIIFFNQFITLHSNKSGTLNSKPNGL